MIAALTDLRNPVRLLRAADAGEVVVLTERGKPRYELKKSCPAVDWESLELERATWLNETESKELSEAIERSGKVLTDATVP
jgi:hypothetical protein